jgi:hypothetical protein
VTYIQSLELSHLARSAFVRRLVWFNLRATTYTHADWNHELAADHTSGNSAEIYEHRVSAVHVIGMESQLNGRQAQTSYKKHAITPYCWQMTDAMERTFLLALDRFRGVVFDIGLSMHRRALLGVLSGAVMRAVRDVLGADRVDFVVQQTHSIADHLPLFDDQIADPDFSSLVGNDADLNRVFLDSIERDGAMTILLAIRSSPDEFFDRAKTRWPRAWSQELLSPSLDDAVLARKLIVEHVLIPRLAGEQWLF